MARFIRLSQNSFCLPGDRGSLQWRRKRIQRLTGSAARSTADHPVCALQQKGQCLKCFRQAAMRRWPYMRTSLKKMEKRNCAFLEINGQEHASQLTDAELKTKIRRVDLCGDTFRNNISDNISRSSGERITLYPICRTPVSGMKKMGYRVSGRSRTGSRENF